MALEGGIVGSINRIKMDYKMTFARAFLPAGSTVVTCLPPVVSLMTNLNYYPYEGIQKLTRYDSEILFFTLIAPSLVVLCHYSEFVDFSPL